MKVAITSDVHLKNYSESPERYNALEKIFEKIRQEGVTELIIAGDLFEKDYDNYSDFDKLCKKYKDVVKVNIIPGNHDYQIEKKFFTASNIKVITEPQIKEINNLPFLFVPYFFGKTIDEVLVDFSHNHPLPGKWILIGHGDYITKSRELNPYEPGFYMPLTAKAIDNFNPTKVILGHIHKPSEFGRVIYPGSPCGLDINETGKRRFLFLDTHSLEIKHEKVETDVIYFIEIIQILPVEDEINFLSEKLRNVIQNWKLKPDELRKVKLRLVLKGYTKDKNITTQHIVRMINHRGIKFYDGEPDTSELRVLKEIDVEKISLLRRFQEKLEELKIERFVSSRDEIVNKTIELIFGS